MNPRCILFFFTGSARVARGDFPLSFVFSEKKTKKNGQKSSIHPVDLSWFHHPRGSGMVPRHLRRDPKVAVFPQEVEEYPGYSLKPEEFPGFRNLGYTKAYKV